MKYLHKGHKINISFVKLILQYPHLKHKMPTSFFLWFLQYTQMLCIKYACSMKKMMKINNRKLEENSLEQEKKIRRGKSQSKILNNF